MFGTRIRDDRPATPLANGSNGSARRGMFSVIGADVVISGNVQASAELHVEGRIEGDVDCAGLIQGAESHIVGGVTAESARIAGAIEGTVRVRQLTVERTARITGDVEYENITIENGGHIDGRMRRIGATTVTITPLIGSDAPRAPLATTVEAAAG
ncbi:polymer-forming cytoskeletal protein [Sphingomonas sp.]|uniref:bactofilin family protein n=1 Tax=Sphingomonas sp. TaxID=28214 RepID=UPI002ED8B153